MLHRLANGRPPALPAPHPQSGSPCAGTCGSGVAAHRCRRPTRRTSIALNWKLEFRAITNRSLKRDSSVMIEGAPGGIDPAAERRFRYNAAIPHRGQQVVLAYDAIPIADETQQKIEHPRFD